MLTQQASIRVAPHYQPILRELGIDADLIFVHPLIKIFSNFRTPYW